MSFKAYYNIATDSIEGCNPFSYAWFHEKRHQQQFKDIKNLKSINQWLEVITYGLNSGFLLAGMLNLNSTVATLLFMGASSVPYSLFNLLLELDAMLFGTIDWLKYKKNNAPYTKKV